MQAITNRATSALVKVGGRNSVQRIAKGVALEVISIRGELAAVRFMNCEVSVPMTMLDFKAA